MLHIALPVYGSHSAGVCREVNSIFGNNGTAGVYDLTSGTGGYGGYFEHSNSTAFGIVLRVVTNGHGSAFVVNHNRGTEICWLLLINGAMQ